MMIEQEIGLGRKGMKKNENKQEKAERKREIRKPDEIRDHHEDLTCLESILKCFQIKIGELRNV
jgi:hypothetical protein